MAFKLIIKTIGEGGIVVIKLDRGGGWKNVGKVGVSNRWNRYNFVPIACPSLVTKVNEKPHKFEARSKQNQISAKLCFLLYFNYNLDKLTCELWMSVYIGIRNKEEKPIKPVLLTSCKATSIKQS